MITGDAVRSRSHCTPGGSAGLRGGSFSFLALGAAGSSDDGSQTSGSAGASSSPASILIRQLLQTTADPESAARAFVIPDEVENLGVPGTMEYRDSTRGSSSPHLHGFRALIFSSSRARLSRLEVADAFLSSAISMYLAF